MRLMMAPLSDSITGKSSTQNISAVTVSELSQ